MNSNHSNRNIRIKIITKFFNELNNLTEYAILHHVDKIYSNDDDIDFVVKYDTSAMLIFVKQFVNKNHAFLFNYYMIDIDIVRFDIFYYNQHVLEKIELDCACNSKKNNLLSIDTKKLLDKRVLININENKFYKVANYDEVEYYIKKKAFKNTDVIQYMNYFQYLNINITEKEVLFKFKIWNKYFNSTSFKIKFKINKVILFLNRMFNKQSLTVSFMGPDGSGKSTIIDYINKYPLYNNSYYFHLKPIYISSSKSIVVDEPHKKPVYSKSKSYIKLLYFIYQYNFGWIKNILKLKIKSSLIIFDRYYDDLLVDNKRYRYGGSLALARLAKFFIPKPNLYFILTTDAKIIYERKQEVPFEELERQIKGYQALADGKRYFNIDVNRTPDEIVKEITLIMMEKMNERY